MNKDNSIKDLKQYNDKIKTQLEYSKARVWSLERENDRLTNELNTCMIERNNFLSRIEKAVEYIDVITNKSIYESGYGKGTAITICKEHLLDILNGDNNEN